MSVIEKWNQCLNTLILRIMQKDKRTCADWIFVSQALAFYSLKQLSDVELVPFYKLSDLLKVSELTWYSNLNLILMPKATSSTLPPP